MQFPQNSFFLKLIQRKNTLNDFIREKNITQTSLIDSSTSSQVNLRCQNNPRTESSVQLFSSQFTKHNKNNPRTLSAQSAINENSTFQSVEEKYKDSPDCPIKRAIDWSVDAQFQCYPKIFKTKYLELQILWSLLFVVLFSSTVFVFGRTISEFSEREVVTQIKMVQNA